MSYDCSGRVVYILGRSKGEHPRHHLKNFHGALQAHVYAGFHHLYGDHFYEAASCAHARRKFHEIHVVHASPATTEAPARIGAIHVIEDEIRGTPADLRLPQSDQLVEGVGAHDNWQV